MNRRSRDGFYAIWTMAIFLSLILAMFTVFFVSCQKAPETAEDSAAADAAGEASAEPAAEATPAADPPATTETTISPILAQTADYGPTYLEDFIFVGDTNSYALSATGALPRNQVWSTENGELPLADYASTYILYGDDTSTTEMLIYNAAALRQPEYVVINIGLTGLSQISEEEFKAAYTALIQTIQMASPDTKILCQSILPVVDTIAGDASNSRITRANEWILEVASQTDTRYLNAAELLMDETGNLRSEYASSDGIFLSKAGCEAVLLYVRTHAYT